MAGAKIGGAPLVPDATVAARIATEAAGLRFAVQADLPFASPIGRHLLCFVDHVALESGHWGDIRVVTLALNEPWSPAWIVAEHGPAYPEQVLTIEGPRFDIDIVDPVVEEALDEDEDEDLGFEAYRLADSCTLCDDQVLKLGGIAEFNGGPMELLEPVPANLLSVSCDALVGQDGVLSVLLHEGALVSDLLFS